MKHNTVVTRKKLLCAAVLSAWGLTGALPTASAVNLPNGDWIIRINVTPTSVFMGSTLNLVGSDGAWNSSFTFGGPVSATSQGMTDTAAATTGSDGTARGSGSAGDSLAGVVGISVSNNIVAVTSFTKDAIFATAGGTFVQYYGSGTTAPPNTVTSTVNGPCGVVTDADSRLDLMLTNRLGAISAPNVFFNNPWNVDDITPYNDPSDPARVVWVPFTTTSISNGTDVINGASLTNIGDQNSDGIDDYRAVLVTGALVGNSWGTSFASVGYFEIWNVEIRSVDNSPAVSLATCNIPGIEITTTDPVINAIKAGAKGCSLSPASVKVSEAGAWGLVFGFLAWLGGLMWWRKRSKRSQV
jgi:hypothetical protein